MGAPIWEIEWPGARRGVLVIWLVLLAVCLPQPASAVSSEAEVSTYLEAHRRTLERRLADYNRKHRLAVHSNAQWTLKIFDWEVIALEGERVFANISFQVGRTNWSPAPGAALFELALTDDGPDILSHQPLRADPTRSRQTDPRVR